MTDTNDTHVEAEPVPEVDAAPAVVVKPPAHFLTHNADGTVNGVGHTPDGTIPSTGAVECTQEQANAWQGSTIVDSAIVAPPPPTTDQLAATARTERNALLTASDWSQGRDVPDAVASKWTPYRQALRDLTKQAGFPGAITWPVSP